jgi:UDP-glucose 4-epimerase
LTVEHYLEYYRLVHRLRYVVLRYANVYGPRQDPAGEAGVVAIFCDRVLSGAPLTIYGDGEQTRDYVYVGDVARANLLALQYSAGSIESTPSPSHHLSATATPGLNALNGRNVFNIGTGLETSVNALASLLMKGANSDCPLVHQPARMGEQVRSVIDPGLAKHALGWEPLTPLAEGLLRTLAWFRSKKTTTIQRSAQSA